eukprot:484152_1
MKSNGHGTIRPPREGKSKLEERLTKSEDRMTRSNRSKSPGCRSESRLSTSMRRDLPRSSVSRRCDESRSATPIRHEARSDSSSSRRQSATQCRAKRPGRDGDNSYDMDLESDQELRTEVIRELLNTGGTRLKRVCPPDDMVDPTPPDFQSVKTKSFSEPTALSLETHPSVTTYATRGAESDVWGVWRLRSTISPDFALFPLPPSTPGTHRAPSAARLAAVQVVPQQPAEKVRPDIMASAGLLGRPPSA